MAWSVLVLVVAACGDPGAEPADGPGTAADGPHLFPTGTPLGDGFVVPAGSVALTQPIAGPYLAASPPSWTVELIPTDPIEAMNDLIAQALDLGFQLGTHTPTPCTYDDDVPESGTTNQTPWPPPDGQPEPRAVSCSVSGFRAGDGFVERLELSTTLGYRHAYEPGARGGISLEHMSAGALDGPLGGQPVDSEPIAPMPEDWSTDEDLPAAPALKAGDALVPTDEAGLWEHWVPRLVDGSRLVVPTRTPVCQGGFAAVLDVTGDPDEVMAGYVEQLRESSAEFGLPPTTTEGTLFDRRVVHAVSSVDGTSLHAVMVVGLDGEPTRLNYSVCSG